MTEGFAPVQTFSKALALGADGVLICRPFVVAVYGGGEEGVKLYIDKLGAELKECHADVRCTFCFRNYKRYGKILSGLEKYMQEDNTMGMRVNAELPLPADLKNEYPLSE